ncbi:MAG: OmpA family protein, partial [Gemmatimonadales bacterium]
IRFVAALTSAPGAVAEARAVATGDAGGVAALSPEAIAWVQVRRAWPMDTRAAIGKVWVDLDRDGRQGAGEPGLAGIDIWTEDGEVARTDATGKFSFDDVRPGRHAFRLDARSLDGAYMLVSDEIQLVEASGWTTPRVDFRVVPLAAALISVRRPLDIRFAAVPVFDTVAVCREPTADGPWRASPAVRLPFGSASVDAGTWAAGLEPVAGRLRTGEACAARIDGHADRRAIRSGPYRDNVELSRARGESIATYLAAQGIEPGRLFVNGLGDTRPVAPGLDSLALERNRRVEVFLDARAPERAPSPEPVAMRYEVAIQLPAGGAADARLRFSPAADSGLVFVGDSLVRRVAGAAAAAIALPAGREVRVQAWSSEPRDTVAAALEIGRDVALVRAPLHNPVAPVALRTAWAAAVLPAVDSVDGDGEVEIVLESPRAGWPEATYDMPAGWRPVPGSVRLGERAGRDPELEVRPAGGVRLRWRFAGEAWAPITLRAVPVVRATAAPETVAVAVARPAAERVAERQQAFLRGPGIEIFAPADGAVAGGDRVFVGVRGEPNAVVVLYDGTTPVDTGRVRVDGVHDFIAIPLARGPHRLRVVMKNSWGQERWDSVAVHVTGLPARLEVSPSPVRLVADGRSTAEAAVRVLDRWGVPVVHPAYVTLMATGADVVGVDADPSSVGLQLRSDSAGRLRVTLRPGRAIGRGTLELSSGDATAEAALEVLPEIRPLTVTGSGLVGVGASPEGYGAITARGRLDERTSLTLGVDSRRLDAGRDAFGRRHDPLEEAQYPILGDAAERQTVTASQSWFSARIERGFDWVAAGDVATSGFAEGLHLVRYRRALTGVAARVTTGAVTWSGFGSLTGQSLRQIQLRGAGVSGPYDLGPDVREGSEYLRIETRAIENAQRTIAAQSLTRFVDYQIDYRRGVVLFKRPIPAADAAGNPVFIVATFEVSAGADARLVAGARAAVDATSLVGARGFDSLRVGLSAVTAGDAAADYRLVGADLRVLRYGGLDVGGEVAYAEQGDSAGVATAARVGYSLAGGDVTLGFTWTAVGREFANPGNVALRGGTSELALTGGWRSALGELRGEYA